MIIDHSLVSPEDIKAAVEVAINSQYTDLASLTILVFDWMLTFPSEVELVWGSKWSAMTILYFLTRYIPFVYLPANTRYIFNEGFTLSECKMLYSTVSSLFWIGILFAQLILTIRTWVIWGKSKKLAYWLFGLYGSVCIIIVTLSTFHLEGTLHGPGETYSNSCDATTQKSSRCLGAALTILAAYETVILTLIVVRGLSSHWPMGRSRLVKTIYCDGIRFYIYLFALGITNLVLIFRLPEYMTISLMLEGACYSVLSCRVILHIRQEFEETLEVDSEGAILGY
ncbi:hypothetical protein Agabi119p4_4271 [Agaricus bisporus var. burnettii]|uniref:DUF6533 domain-containing protein n=1 Tax=Agaricus bisporus var. burnettii TaxID=192524 RepID=A0A8H7KH88_AGABI|nr:hypothetical protein Agabi119p4_4271 [Agaricus bisporus var. burnettii]